MKHLLLLLLLLTSISTYADRGDDGSDYGNYDDDNGPSYAQCDSDYQCNKNEKCEIELREDQHGNPQPIGMCTEIR